MNRWMVSGLGMLAFAVACTQAVRSASNGDESVGVRASPFSAGAFSPEFALEHPAAVATYTEFAPHVATAASASLLVWESDDIDHTDLWAMRLDASGQPLAPRATLVTRVYGLGGRDVFSPAVGTDGTDFLVAWTEGNTLVGARVRGADGAVLDDATHRIALGPWGYAVTIGSDGSHWVVASYRSTNGAETVQGVLVTGTTAQPIPALDALTFPTNPNTGDFPNARPAIAAGNGMFWVAADNLGLRIRASDGTALDAAPVQFAKRSAGATTTAAFDGTNFYNVWVRGALYAARVRAADGVLLDPDDDFNNLSGSILLGGGPYAWRPTVAPLGGQLVVAYQALATSNASWGPVSTFRVDPSTGKTNDPSGETIFSGVGIDGFGVAFSSVGGVAVGSGLVAGGGIGAVGLTQTNGIPRLVGAVVPASLVGSLDSAPVVASNGTDWLAMWLWRGTVFAGRVRGSDRTLLDATPMAIASSISGKAAIGTNGSDYLAAWTNGAAVYARKIGADGTLGDSITVSPGPSFGSTTGVAVAYDGARYVVGWNADSMYARRLDGATLALMDSSDILVGGGGSTVGAPAVIADKAPDLDHETFLFVSLATNGGISAARLRGKLGAAVDLGTPIPIGTRSDQYGTVRVAYDGTSALVAWSDANGGQVAYYGARVLPLDGTRLDPTPVLLAQAPRSAAEFDLAFDGKAYAFASLDGENGSGEQTLRVFRVAPSLALLDPPGAQPGVIASTAPMDNATVSLARGPSGQVLVAYPIWSGDPNDVGEAVWGRTFTDDWDGTLPEAGTDATAPDAAPDGGTRGGAEAGVDAAIDAPVDAWVSDGAPADATATDAWVMDATPPRDAAPEASAPRDASGGGPDGAPAPPPPSTSGGGTTDGSSSGGCGCRAAGEMGASWPSGAAAIALALAGMRRRSRARRV